MVAVVEYLSKMTRLFFTLLYISDLPITFQKSGFLNHIFFQNIRSVFWALFKAQVTSSWSEFEKRPSIFRSVYPVLWIPAIPFVKGIGILRDAPKNPNHQFTIC